MQASLRDWLNEAGYRGATDLRPLRAGLGSTSLWTFRPSPSPQDAPLVVRVFGAESGSAAQHEALAMRSAAAHGVPVPEIMTHGRMENRPVLVTTFATGQTVSELLREHPDRAHAIGQAMGEVLGRLHGVIAPDGLMPPKHTWIDRGGPALAPIRDLLEGLPNTDRLLHLDYHPDNVLSDGERITAIIDWENTLPGPPHMDIARTQAILQAIHLSGRLPAELEKAFDAFDRGIVAGHVAIAGADPHPALSEAWGLAMTVDDLERQLGKPGNRLGEDVVARLRAARDQRIASIMSGGLT